MAGLRERVTFRLGREDLARLDRIVRERGFSGQAEALRWLIWRG